MTDDAAKIEPEAPPAEAAAGGAGATATAAANAEETGDLVFDTLWGRVLAAWDDDKTHGAALEYALRAHRLPELAGRYRALADDPEKGTRAKKRIDGIVVAATQIMLSTKTPKLEKTPSYLTWTAFLLFVIVVGFLWYAIAVKH